MLRDKVLKLVLAEQEDLSDPVSLRWLSYCQEQAALAALQEIHAAAGNSSPDTR
jgi:hypothetical protein